MPNHVENRVSVFGSKEDVALFREMAEGTGPWFADSFKKTPWNQNVPSGPDDMDNIPFTFHGIVPLPEEVKAHDYSSYGYNAERKTWGVKWGPYGNPERFNVAENIVEYTYRTAWDIGTKFWIKASQKFPDLYFCLTATEEDCQRGRFVFHDGEKLEFAWERFNEPYDKEDEDAWRERLDEWYAEYYSEENHRPWAYEKMIGLLEEEVL